MVAKTLTTNRHAALIKMLIEARERAGLTQTEYAKQLGEYQSYVARLESGQRRVDVVELIAFSSILGIDPVEMVRHLQEDIHESDS